MRRTKMRRCNVQETVSGSQWIYGRAGGGLSETGQRDDGHSVRKRSDCLEPPQYGPLKKARWRQRTLSVIDLAVAAQPHRSRDLPHRLAPSALWEILLEILTRSGLLDASDGH
jgi:hypothetical protein